MSAFEFKITVNNPDAAAEKIKAAFAEHGMPVDPAGAFSGKGFEGRYVIVGHEVRVVVTDKPILVMNWQIQSQVRGFLDGV